MRLQSSLWLTTATLAFVGLVWSSHLGTATETSAIDPTGTWKIARINPDTKSKAGSEQTLKLKVENGKLTGSITGRSSTNGKVRSFEWAIKETKLQGNDVSFTVTHAPVIGEGPDSTTVYEGKITGDIMKRKLEMEFNGQTFKRDWEANRVKQ